MGRPNQDTSATALETLHPFLLLVLGSALIMLLPAAHALQAGDRAVAQAFLTASLGVAVLAITVILATVGRPPRSTGTGLTMLPLTFLGLPVFLAAPLALALPTVTPLQSYFEMLSCLTTTGATLFDRPAEVPATIHLWRGMVGWLGGFVFLVAALAILEPLKIGGFELEETIGTGRSALRRTAFGALQVNRRILRFVRLVAVPYATLTGALLLGLLTAGEEPLTALIHALSTLSTSGISPLDSPSAAESGRWGEVLIFLFLFAAVTQKAFRAFWNRELTLVRATDPEFKIALVLVVGMSILIVLRHFFGAIDVDAQDDLTAVLRALWGSAFTALSYLTTMGFESLDWEESRRWSGLDTPGLILLGLAVMGGGIATTAGGVKLLRVYALYKHGAREMSRLVHPNSVGGAGMTARRIRREGAAVAWVFLMLFILGIAVSLLALTLAGQEFDVALALSVAALTNTGPAAYALDTGVRLIEVSGATKIVLCAAMVVGRLEALVVISLLNPGYWRG
ncbi:MAG: potassium transporter TrkG [Pseudomonadota bacterium]